MRLYIFPRGRSIIHAAATILAALIVVLAIYIMTLVKP